MIEYDPDKKAEVTAEIVKAAERYRLHIINVLCDPPGAKIEDQTGVAFISLSPFLPRPGDKIDLEDGRVCKVKGVSFQVVTERDSKGKARFCALVPNVYAIALRK